MNNKRWLAPFINFGHFLDHLAMLVFPTVVIALVTERVLARSPTRQGSGNSAVRIA